MKSPEEKLQSSEWKLKEPSGDIELRESEGGASEIHAPAEVIPTDESPLNKFEKHALSGTAKDSAPKKSLGEYSKSKQLEPKVDGIIRTLNFNWISVVVMAAFLMAWQLDDLSPLSFIAVSAVPYFVLLFGVFIAKLLSFDQLWFRNRKTFVGRRPANTLLTIMLVFAPAFSACLYLEGQMNAQADASFASSHYADAYELYGRLAELTNVSYFVMRQGECLIEMGQFQKAADLYSAAIVREPSLELYTARAKALERLHKNTLSQKDKASANELQKQLGDAASAQILFDNRQFDEALKNYNRIVAQQPKSANIYVLRAKCLYQLKKYSEAIADCTQAISLNPKFGEAFYERSMAYDQLGKSELARNDRIEARLLGYRHYSVRSPN